MRQSFNPEPPDDKVVACINCGGRSVVCGDCLLGFDLCSCLDILGGADCLECDGTGEVVVPA